MPKSIRNVFTKDFLDLVKYLQTTHPGARLLAKIMKVESRQRYHEHYTTGDYSLKCPRKLLQIMESKTMCPRTAKLIEPHLRSYEKYHTVYRNERLLEAVVIQRNCNGLRGELAQKCLQYLEEKLQAKPSIKYETLFNGLHNCYLEAKESHSFHFKKK